MSYSCKSVLKYQICIFGKPACEKTINQVNICGSVYISGVWRSAYRGTFMCGVPQKMQCECAYARTGRFSKFSRADLARSTGKLNCVCVCVYLWFTRKSTRTLKKLVVILQKRTHFSESNEYLYILKHGLIYVPQIFFC